MIERFLLLKNIQKLRDLHSELQNLVVLRKCELKQLELSYIEIKEYYEKRHSELMKKLLDLDIKLDRRRKEHDSRKVRSR